MEVVYEERKKGGETVISRVNSRHEVGVNRRVSEVTSKKKREHQIWEKEMGVKEKLDVSVVQMSVQIHGRYKKNFHFI